MTSPTQPLMKILTLIFIIATITPYTKHVQALWFFESATPNTTSSSLAQLLDTKKSVPEQSVIIDQATERPFTIAGINPSGIASLLNSVSETGFTYFNVHDQCRSRTACDVGFMLYKKLNFVHNWLIRTSVRTLVDNNNVYASSWNSGMLGKNCTLIYPACNQSPFESIMNFALLGA